jgi:DNA-binding transcriptional MerR regulator
MTSKSSDKELYGIGAVAKLTGLTDHTIRVWERRYDAVVARRAPNGRRVYTPSDVEKLGLLKRLTSQGLSIGQIAGDSIEQLRERAESMSAIVTAPVPDRIRIGVLGDFMPDRVRTSRKEIGPLEVVIAESSPDRFIADLNRNQLDVIVLESPVLDHEVTDRLAEYMQQANAPRGVIVYSFGRVRDIDHARDAHIVAVRAPVGIEELRSAVMRAYTPAAPRSEQQTGPSDSSQADWDFAGPIAARRFSNQQLINLAQASTAIDCECPHHLAQLVGDLTAFEVYSANCANRDEEDAALHRYLHQTTAQARALIEVALQRVADAEGIDY